MTSPRALFVVEEDFLSKHVGVKRVVLHYSDALQAAGWTVEYAVQDTDAYRPVRVTSSRRHELRSELLVGESVELSDYALVVITAPWVIHRPLPALPNSVGIVYDTAPNLIAAGVVELQQSIDAYGFAAAHAYGFREYEQKLRRILCISESTARDYRRFVREKAPRTAAAPEIVVDIPFDPPRDARVARRRRPRVLLVNALDWRKNFLMSAAVLKRLADSADFEVVVVGKERIPAAEARDFLTELRARGTRVRWIRWATERRLDALYRTSTAILFPSLYEGLGMPVLEAQARGCPAVTSNTSSCSEVNVNVELRFDPADVEGMAGALLSLLLRESTAATGRRLIELNSDFLNRTSHPVTALTELVNEVPT